MFARPSELEKLGPSRGSSKISVKARLSKICFAGWRLVVLTSGGTVPVQAGPVNGCLFGHEPFELGVSSPYRASQPLPGLCFWIPRFSLHRKGAYSSIACSKLALPKAGGKYRKGSPWDPSSGSAAGLSDKFFEDFTV